MLDAKTTASPSIRSLATEQLNTAIALLKHVEALQRQTSSFARFWPDIVFGLLNGNQLSTIDSNDTREALSRAFLSEGRVLKRLEGTVQELRHQRTVLLTAESLIDLNCRDDGEVHNAR